MSRHSPLIGNSTCWKGESTNASNCSERIVHCRRSGTKSSYSKKSLTCSFDYLPAIWRNKCVVVAKTTSRTIRYRHRHATIAEAARGRCSVNRSTSSTPCSSFVLSRCPSSGNRKRTFRNSSNNKDKLTGWLYHAARPGQAEQPPQTIPKACVEGSGRMIMIKYTNKY